VPKLVSTSFGAGQLRGAAKKEEEQRKGGQNSAEEERQVVVEQRVEGEGGLKDF